MTEITNSPKLPATRVITVCASSARWLAESAVHAGYEVLAIDLFGDWDLQKIAKQHYQLPSISRLIDLELHVSGALVVGGGLESNLKALERFTMLPSWRNSSLESLRCCRDPFYWTDQLAKRNLPFATVKGRLSGDEAGRWLKKSYDSTGGSGVEWCSFDAANDNDNDNFYFQEYVKGRSLSSLHASNGNKTALLGVFKQLIGNSFLDSGSGELLSSGTAGFQTLPFQFQGAIGPMNPSLLQCLQIDVEQIERVGSVVAEATGIQGVFGIDWVQNEYALVPVEINPRLTSSGELWERATGQSLLGIHLQGLEGGDLADYSFDGLIGKAVAFCTRDDMQVTERLHQQFVLFWEEGWVADIPQPGVEIQKGHPIVTVFASAADARNEDSIEWVRRSLRSRVFKVQNALGDATKMGSHQASH